MDRVSVSSEIPPSHAGKHVIENACRQAMRGLKGDWALTIRLARGGTWWLLRLHGPDFDRTLLLDPADQVPHRVHVRLREVLWEAGYADAGAFVKEDSSLVELFDSWLPPTANRPPTRNLD
jgi:hypothetical protein